MTKNVGVLNRLSVKPDGTFDTNGAYPSAQNDIQEIIAAIDKNGINKLVFHFHGGLVDETSAMGSAEHLLANVYSANDTHALFFIWETGFMTSVTEWIKGFKEESIKSLVVRIQAWAKHKITSQEGTDEYLTDFDPSHQQLKNLADLYVNRKAFDTVFVSDETIISNLADELKAFDEEILNPNHKLNSAYQKYLQENTGAVGSENVGSEEFIGFGYWIVARVVVETLKRYVNDTDHKLQATITESLLRVSGVYKVGVGVWQEMKDQAKSMWENDNPLVDNPRVGYSFLNALSVYLSKRDSSRPFCIDVVGHSAGSIVIVEMLNAILKNKIDNIKIRNVIFIAPAIRMDKFKSEFIDVPAILNNINSISQFTMDDKRELSDVLVGDNKFIYPSSLLYAISGFLEDDVDAKILGMQRFYTDTAPYKQQLERTCAKFFQDRGNTRLLVSVGKEDNPKNGDLQTHATEHGGGKDSGGFIFDEQTNKSIKSILDRSCA